MMSAVVDALIIEEGIFNIVILFMSQDEEIMKMTVWPNFRFLLIIVHHY